MSRRVSRYLAALNRVAIGVAPKFGSAGAIILEQDQGRVVWWRWRANASLARVVRRRRPWGTD